MLMMMLLLIPLPREFRIYGRARVRSHTHKTCHLPWVYTAVDIADDDEDDDDYRSISQLGVYTRVRACAAGERRPPPNRTTS